MTHTSRVFVIIPAGGVGTRMGLPYPKQLHPFGKTTVLAASIALFHPRPVIVAAPENYLDVVRRAVPVNVTVVSGGNTRFESVKKAFDALSCLEYEDLVIIHDAARPFYDPGKLEEACGVAREKGAVIYAAQATDTVKVVGEFGAVTQTLPRETIYMAQTPQIFKVGVLREAYSKMDPEFHATDEAGLLEEVGLPVYIFPSSPSNKKLTLLEDLELLNAPQITIGHGYDVHSFDETRPLYLGGLLIPDAPGLAGHSDADVLLHALMDAMLGAAGLGDIGHWFPDNDPSLKGVRSTLLLKKVVDTLSQKGFLLQSADMTVLAQVPKLAPHMEGMKQMLCKILEISNSQINIKATTTEGLGFIGRKEGMAAHAVVLLSRRPNP